MGLTKRERVGDKRAREKVGLHRRLCPIVPLRR